MVLTADRLDGPPASRGWQAANGRQRAVAIGVVGLLHLGVIGGFVIAGQRPPTPPPERVLEVSFISSAPATPSPPSPPQPTEQTPTPPTPAPTVRPQPTLLATPAPTQSAMSAPPVERRTSDVPTPAAAAAASPPAAAASAPASASATPGPVTPPNFSAAYLNNPGPTYPAASRRKREQGTVRMRVQVNPDGGPIQVLLDRSSGSTDLDAAAMDVVKKRWRFAPAQQGGRAVAAWVIVPLEFSLTR